MTISNLELIPYNTFYFVVNTDKIVVEYPNYEGVIPVDNTFFLYYPLSEGGSLPVFPPGGNFKEATFILRSLTNSDLTIHITSFIDANNGGIIGTQKGLRSKGSASFTVNEVVVGTIQRFSIGFKFDYKGHTYHCSLDPKLRATQPPNN